MSAVAAPGRAGPARETRSSATRIVLVRHGHVEGIDPPTFRGRADLPLTEHGIRQAAATRDYLVTVAQPTAAYTSPLSRCVRTAEIIAQPHGLAPQPLAQLSDIDYGAWQGRTFEDVRKSAPEAFADWLRRPHFAAIPGGEALDGVAMRVAGVLRLVLSQHSSETVLLVGHDSVNRVMLLLALEMPIDHYWSFRQSPCGLSILDDNDAGGWVATCVNETAHLAGVVSNR